MRYRFIEDRCVDDPVTMMRDVLGVSPAGWRARRKRDQGEESKKPSILAREMSAIT
jgi:putative transposase